MIDLKKEMAIIKEKKDINKKNQKPQKKSLVERAEDFATIVASLVDGGAPVLGAALPLIPFLCGTSLELNHFIFSYIILIGLLIYLGFFLGKISGGGKVRYAIHLVIAGIVTLVLSLLLGSISG